MLKYANHRTFRWENHVTKMTDVTFFSILYAVATIGFVLFMARKTLFSVTWPPLVILVPIGQLYALGELMQLKVWGSDFVRFYLSNVGFPVAFLLGMGAACMVRSWDRTWHAYWQDLSERKLARSKWTMHLLIRGSGAMVVAVANWELLTFVVNGGKPRHPGGYDVGDVAACAVGVLPIVALALISLRRLNKLSPI